MKKIIALLLCLMLALSVAGCTAKEVAADDKTTAQSDAQGSEASDSEITEPVEIIWQWDVPEEGKQE